MILSDFISRQTNDDSNAHEVIPISFNMHQILQENYYGLETCLVQTRCHNKSSGVKLPEVHDVQKGLDPKIKPEKKHAGTIKGCTEKSSIGQAAGGSKRTEKLDTINQPINSLTELSKRVTGDGITTEGTHTCQGTDAIYKQCK